MRRRNVSQSKRSRVINQSGGGGCAKCPSRRKDDMHIHHVVAVSDGGADDESNLVALCRRCHLEWHFVESTSPLTFGMWLKLPPYYAMAKTWIKRGYTITSQTFDRPNAGCGRFILAGPFAFFWKPKPRWIVTYTKMP